MAIVEKCYNVVLELLFTLLPGTPAENRWTAMNLFIAWLMPHLCFFGVGGPAFIAAFRNAEMFNDDASENDVSPEMLQRIQIGKRTRRGMRFFENTTQNALRVLTP